MKFLSKRSAVLAFAAVAAVAWACDSPGPSAAPAAISGASRATAARRGTGRQPSAHVLDVAEVHNKALIRFFGNLDSYIGKRGKRTQASRCEGIRRLTREVIRDANRTAGIQENAAVDQALADGAVSQGNAACRQRHQASLFIPKRPGGDEIVTASAAPYLEALRSGYSGMADPYPGSIASVNDNVLTAASGESQANFDAIYMTTQFALGDAALWVGLGEVMGDAAFCDPDSNPDGCLDPPDEMMLFAPKAIWILRALYATVSDLAGCIGSEVVDAHAGNVSEHDMYVHCAGYGAAASVGYGMKELGGEVGAAINAIRAK
jgi:hypothetical protein